MADLPSLLQPLLDQAGIRAALKALSSPAAASPLPLSGLTPAAKAVAVAALAYQLKRPVVVLTRDNEAAQNYRQTTATFLGWLSPGAESSVQILPAFDCTPYEGRSPHAEIQEQRAVALWSMARGAARVVFAPVAAALGRLRESGYYASLALELKVGDELSLDDLVEHLRSVGYEPGEPVSAVGQYSLRGGIIDVFPPEAEWPYRLEFFGDQIESLREFDPTTQRSRKPAPRAMMLPLSEAQRSPQFFERLVRVLALQAREHAQMRGTPLPQAEPEWAAEHSNTFPGWEFFVPLVEPHTHTLFSLLPHPVVIWDEFLDRRTEIGPILEGLAAGFEEVRDIVPPRPAPGEIDMTEAEFLQAIKDIPQISLKELAIESLPPPAETPSQAVVIGGDLYFPPEGEDFAKEMGKSSGQWPVASGEQPTSPNASPSLPGRQPPAPSPESPAPVFSTQPPPKFQGGVKALVDDVRARVKHGESVVFVVPTSGKVDRLREILKDYEIPFDLMIGRSGDRESKGQTAAQKSADHPIAGVFIARGEIREGFAIPDLKQLWLADADLFGGFDWAARGRRERSGISSFISDLSDLKVGDYVVHLDHGIGIYQGLRQLAVGTSPRDFMLLTFQDDAKLYVPLERLDLVEKYRSHEGAKPPLDRLGGATWERTKSRVKRALRDMAQELLQLYAERKMRGGFAATPDTPWQREFEDAFAFEETPDQLSAMADIKRDLESPEPMDRLLCGDVGYGKTELAMRAAFKVVQDGRQVAVLTPTTVLAFQHYNTFRQRMAAFPLRVEMLSRFRTAAEQKKVVAEAEAGRIDILIGTHRLLSKDVHLRRPGLAGCGRRAALWRGGKRKAEEIQGGRGRPDHVGHAHSAHAAHVVGRPARPFGD